MLLPASEVSGFSTFQLLVDSTRIFLAGVNYLEPLKKLLVVKLGTTGSWRLVFFFFSSQTCVCQLRVVEAATSSWRDTLSVKPWFNFFSSTLVQEAFLITSLLCGGEIIANSESKRTENEAGLKTQKWFVIKSSRKPRNNCPLNIIVRKVFCSSALYGEKPYWVQHSNRQGWISSPQTDWFEKCFWLSALYGKTSSSSESE